MPLSKLHGAACSSAHMPTKELYVMQQHAPNAVHHGKMNSLSMVVRAQGLAGGLQRCVGWMQQLGGAACDGICCFTATDDASSKAGPAAVSLTGAIIVLHGRYIECKPSAGLTDLAVVQALWCKTDLVQAETTTDSQLRREASPRHHKQLSGPPAGCM
jgi:hypothetical protein